MLLAMLRVLLLVFGGFEMSSVRHWCQKNIKTSNFSSCDSLIDDASWVRWDCPMSELSDRSIKVGKLLSRFNNPYLEKNCGLVLIDKKNERTGAFVDEVVIYDLSSSEVLIVFQIQSDNKARDKFQVHYRKDTKCDFESTVFETEALLKFLNRFNTVVVDFDLQSYIKKERSLSEVYA